jgi:hypothetical protein|tara:strand:- start:3001 stop:3171 length:171 start_codon:yes stop_codon:yes gene_type:complete
MSVDGEEDDPVDDWASTDLTKLEDKGEDNVPIKKDEGEDKPVRSSTTQTKKKKNEK